MENQGRVSQDREGGGSKGEVASESGCGNQQTPAGQAQEKTLISRAQNVGEFMG